MTELPATADVVVIGGGVMGTSTAYHLAAAGAARVVLLEREPFLGQMSTGQCAGGVRHQFSSEVNVRLSLESIRMLERFPEEPGHDVDLRFCGYVFLLDDPADVDAFRDNVALQRRLGVDTAWLEPEDLAAMLPTMRLDGVVAGTRYDRDGLADPAGVVDGYAAGARRLGAVIATGAPVTGIRTEGGRVAGVEVGERRIDTPVVVNAAGAWAPQIGAMVGVDIPIRPIRRQMAVTTALPGLPPDFPFVVFFGSSLYFHPEGEGVLTGMSNHAQEPGYDMSVDPEWEAVHLEAAMARMSMLEQAGIASRWAGLYEVTPDAHPIFGAVREVEGFHVMAGFSGHGFMHGPVMGKLMAEEVLEGRARTVDVDAFRFDRFRAGDLHPEYNVI